MGDRMDLQTPGVVDTTLYDDMDWSMDTKGLSFMDLYAGMEQLPGIYSNGLCGAGVGPTYMPCSWITHVQGIQLENKC